MTNTARKQEPDWYDAWLTTVDAATHCNMSKRALLQHVARGDLKPDSRARPGFRVHRFLRSSLDSWLKGETNG